MTASGRRAADVWCEGEAISKVAAGIAPPSGATVVEAAGKLVLPGFIDPHVHAYLPLTNVDGEVGLRELHAGGAAGRDDVHSGFRGGGAGEGFRRGVGGVGGAGGGAGFVRLWLPSDDHLTA